MINLLALATSGAIVPQGSVINDGIIAILATEEYEVTINDSPITVIVEDKESVVEILEDIDASIDAGIEAKT